MRQSTKFCRLRGAAASASQQNQGNNQLAMGLSHEWQGRDSCFSPSTRQQQHYYRWAAGMERHNLHDMQTPACITAEERSLSVSPQQIQAGS